MATNQISGFIQRLRGVLRDGAGLTDGQLLGDYLSRRDEAAIAALVRRHGPMVWGVCRRVLHNHHDAEDAFQTTFLVLVRKAASIASRELLANWLYGVAHQTALKARATAAKRKGRERQATEMPEPAATQQDQWRDLQPLLDEELSRLPSKYRSVIVLCDLEGKTRKEVARQLRCPEGTVAGRLARARIMLAKRLTRRGIALSGAALAAVLSQQAASAAVPTSVVVSTIKAAGLLAAGKASAAGAISVKVAALTEGVMKAMLFTKLKAVIAVVLILGFVATGATVLTCRTAAGQEEKPPLAEKPVTTSAKQEPEKKEEIAWGKEVNGLQLGLAFVPADKIVYRPGEEILCEVRVRNVSKAPITINNMIDALEPEITDAKGEKVPIAMPPISLYDVISNEQILKPGETAALYPRKVAVESVPEGKADPNALIGTPTIRVPAGKYKIGLSEFVQSKLKLSTGIVEFEVTDKNAKESPEKKEGFTAWGKEVNGLQLGLALVPADKIAYRPGEEIQCEVRVRNVSKAPITIRNMIDALEPEITDAKGEKVHVAMPPRWDFIVIPTEEVVKPGETVALYPRKVAVERVPEGKADPNALFGTPTIRVPAGKYKIGLSEFVQSKLKLSTGIVEFEVTDKDAKESREMKEGFTAWGKEADGLQAGLGYLPGQHRPYHIGETVTLVVRVRNVSKEAVKFQYLRNFFMENPPTVTDGEGKQVHFRYGIIDDSRVHPPVDVNLVPGKEIELYELTFKFRPASESENEKDTPFYGTGKFQIQYERVFGKSSAGKITVDSALSMLATGKLELEIKPEAPAKPGVKAPEKQAEQDNDAKMKPLKLRVYIEKVNAETQTITASCMLLGKIDNVTKPLKFENLRVSENAVLMEGDKEIKFKLTDLKLDAGYFLYLKAYEDGLGFEVVGIEKIGVGK